MSIASTSSATAYRPLRLQRVPLTVVIAFAIIAVIVAWSIAPGLFTSQSPVSGVPSAKLLGPSLLHRFGTDHLGRDLFARVVYGTASSVTSAGVAVGIGLRIGGLAGLLAGFLGGWVDLALARFFYLLLSIPRFVLAVMIVTALASTRRTRPSRPASGRSRSSRASCAPR